MKSKATWIISGAVAVAIAVIAIAAITASSDEDKSAAGTVSEYQKVSVEGVALPAFVAGQQDPAVGTPAPILRGSGFAGNDVFTTPGTPTLVVFLAHWCQFCQREVPELVKWNTSGKMPASLDVVGVATASNPANPNYPPSAWLAREEWPPLWPVLADSKDGAAATAFGLAGFPFMVLIDAEGKVLWRTSGALGQDRLAEMVAAALPG